MNKTRQHLENTLVKPLRLQIRPKEVDGLPKVTGLVLSFLALSLA